MFNLGKLWHVILRRPYKLHLEIYPSSGQDSNPKQVLLIHGIASDTNIWTPLVPMLLSRGCEVITLDLLGHGRSPNPQYLDYKTEDHARAVIQILKKSHYQNLIVIGHSMGCLVASRIAKLEPELVERLLLYQPPLFADIPDFKAHAKRRKFYFDLYERIAANPAGTLTLARVIAKIADNWTNYLDDEKKWLPIERSLRNTIMEGHTLEELRELNVPIDIIHGRLDFVVPRTELKEMLKENNHVRFFKTTDRHALSKASARFLADMVVPLAVPENTKVKLYKKRSKT